MASPHNLRNLFLAVVLVALVATGLGASYYFASARSARADSARATWAVNPLFITFPSQDGSGSLPDSLTCSPTVGPVTFIIRSNQPDMITLTVSPSGFSSCGSTPDNVVVTATCTASALAKGQCLKGFTGMVTVCGPTPYECLVRSLIVVIQVTNNSDQSGQA